MGVERDLQRAVRDGILRQGRANPLGSAALTNSCCWSLETRKRALAVTQRTSIEASAPVMVPVPLLTLHAWIGTIGCASTLTS
ncbi:MAG: hypothetical protein H6730_34185 [Deltaproteobacteria bacterium]|nr:hypothetical protein [Deltaproteobacteria bacterium]